MRFYLQWAAVAWLAWYAALLPAHEIRPAGLFIQELSDGAVAVRWKLPARGEYPLSISPHLSSGWLEREPDRRSNAADALVLEWRISPPRAELEGQRLTITGLRETITDVFTEVVLRDGGKLTYLIKPEQPEAVISRGAYAGLKVSGYFLLGLRHIASGYDHLAYLLGLVLLLGNLSTLVKTITAFTVAHSITLVCAALELVSLRPAAVEAVIALSIAYVAAELVRKYRDQGGSLLYFPWQAAFAFGLLHGFGFAGALQSIGLPGSNVAGALLLFNLGIEAGQLAFILGLLGLLSGLERVAPLMQRQLCRIASYAIGGMASFWVLDRVFA
ncbi:MAG TPA: HupE/UreJ family protein [Gammaproteobacteria bacterium]|nr:HupE/UreJ family protein [Gammaproteobacteria bacterium]